MVGMSVCPSRAGIVKIGTLESRNLQCGQFRDSVVFARMPAKIRVEIRQGSTRAHALKSQESRNRRFWP